ncbi:MAG TPA: magnesium/cobalt transporter CorA [Solirubrobacterales bacterium]|nr:magnesium/cobalt transporter CorA [Solirubrobacterales bacterium]
MRFLDRIDRKAIGELLARDEYLWLDLRDPGHDEAAALGELFSFHPLALEDMLKRNQRSKLEDYGDFMFLVYYAAGADEARHGGVWTGIQLDEVHAFLSGGYLVTVHQSACRALEEVRERLSAQAPRSEQFVVYRVLDGLTDTFFPVLDRIDGEIERLENDIFERPREEHLEQITELRRDLVSLRRVVTPQRDLLARGIDDILEIPGLEADSRNYFRDVYDHAIRISDQIDSYRDLLAGTRDAYLSVVSNRLNQITKQLTLVATVFLPLSFLVGFFGQNFKWLVQNISSEADFWILGVGGAVISVVGLLVWFRRGSYL